MIDPITRKPIEIKAEDMHNASLRTIAYILGDVMSSDELMSELAGKNKGTK